MRRVTKRRDAIVRDYARAGSHAAHWYELAAAEVDLFATWAELPAQYVADVVAILSPRVQVRRNARLAARYIMLGELSGTMRGRRDALALYEQTGKVSGPKVTAFAANLGGDFDHVTVDTWMAVAYGVDHDQLTPARYQLISDHVAGMAGESGLTPAGVQAAIWVGCREAVGLKDREGYLSIMDAAIELDRAGVLA